MDPGFVRTFLSWAWTSQVSAILTLAATALLTAGDTGSTGALALATPAAVAIALCGFLRGPHYAAAIATATLTFGAWVAIMGVGTWIAGAVLVLAGLSGGKVAVLLAARFPAGLDGALRRRRVLAPLVGLSVLLGLAQGLRLSAFMADRDLVWGSAAPMVEESAEHQCLAAYLYAGELSARGVADVYDAELYPDRQIGQEAQIESAVEGMAAVVDDPYLYPPAFLLLPRLALVLSNDYSALRLGFFAVNATCFLVVSLALVVWVGGRHGLLAGLLLPLVWGSVPTQFNFQFGQFQLLAIALSIGAMVSFDRGRHGLGGLLLAIAILGKIFPGVLALWLLFRGAWRSLGWTLGWALAITLASLVVVGPATYEHFLFEHVPRLASGDVGPFFKDSTFRIGQNISVYGLLFKLQVLGLVEAPELPARILNWVFTLALVVFTCRQARTNETSRAARALAWLGLLALASLRSPYLPAVYGFAGALWLLSHLAPHSAGRCWAIAGVVLAWGLLGPLPPGDDSAPYMALTCLGPLAFLVVGFLALMGRSGHSSPASA